MQKGKMMKGEYPAITVYAVLALIVMLPLLEPGYYLVLDMAFGPNSFADFRFGDFYGYNPSSYGAYLPFKMIFAALSQIISVEIIQKLILFSILFLCGFLMHYSLPKELGGARYFGGFLYMLNPFVFTRFLAGHWTFLLSYAVWPLAIKLFIDFVRKPDDKNALEGVAIITLIASVSSHGVLLLLMSYFVIFVCYAFKSSNFKLLAKQTAVLGILVLAMNLFWIVPTFLLFGDFYSPSSVESYFADFGSKGEELPLPVALLTMHGFWREGFTYTKDVFDFWYVFYIIIAALGAVGLLSLWKKNKIYACSLLAIFILAFLLSMDISGPLSIVFTSLEGMVPIHFIFRDSQKFAGLLCLVYSVSGTYGVNYLSQKTRGIKKTAVILLLVAVPVAYNFGFFGFLEQVGTTAYPEDWVEADEIIAADNISGHVLVLPPHLYSTYPWVNSKQKTLANPAAKFFSKPVITARNVETAHVYSDINDARGQYLKYMYWNRQYINNTAEMLLPLNARYIVLLKNDEEFIHYSWLFDRKGGVEHIELVMEGPTLYLFRNNLVKGPFMSSQENGSGNFRELINLSGNGLYSGNVSYEEITPASYRILDSPYEYVVFARDYNRFLEFDGTPASPWHGLANGFVYYGEGRMENRLFCYNLALFLLSWFIALALIAEISRKQGFILIGLFAIAYLLTSAGLLGPAALGGLLIISLLGAVCLRCLKDGKSVLLLQSTKLFKYKGRKR
jgi:hypothetical protein